MFDAFKNFLREAIASPRQPNSSVAVSSSSAVVNDVLAESEWSSIEAAEGDTTPVFEPLDAFPAKSSYSRGR